MYMILYTIFYTTIPTFFFLNFNSVPLMMGYVTRYVQGTDKLRRNGLEVHGMNGTNSSIIHCDNVKSLSEWVKLISKNIANLAEIQVQLLTVAYIIIIIIV